MSKEKKRIPNLRFPGFEKSGEWKDKVLGGVCDITNGKANARDHVEGGKYLLFDRSEVIKASNEYLFDTEAVIIPGEGMRFIPKYYEGKFNLHQRAYALKDFTISGQFAYYSILYNSALLARKAVQSTVLSLRLPILQNFPILVPKEKEEQRKIAGCLSSLDEVIEAHCQKLELLKDHKKGLLQNLFPQEGEKVPKYRFPEFENDGEWVETSLNKISHSIFDGTHQTPKYTDEGVPFFSVENIVSGNKNKFISKEDYLYETRNNKPEFGDVLITRIGSIGIPKVVDWKYDFSIYVTLAVVKKSDKFDSKYLGSYIQSTRFQKEIHRRSLLKAAPLKINMNELRECEVLLPPRKKEQRKIASGLSDLDELITAQVEKIEQLQQHKKGLMQGFFPKIEN